MDFCPPGSSVHGILQARILERAATPSCRGSFPPRDQARVSGTSRSGGQVLYDWDTWEAPLPEHLSPNILPLGKSWKQSGSKFLFDVIFISYFALIMKRYTITVERFFKRWAELTVKFLSVNS